MLATLRAATTLARGFYTKGKIEKTTQVQRKFIKTKTHDNKRRIKKNFDAINKDMPYLQNVELTESMTLARTKFLLKAYSDIRNMNHTTRKKPPKAELDMYIQHNKEYQSKKVIR